MRKKYFMQIPYDKKDNFYLLNQQEQNIFGFTKLILFIFFYFPFLGVYSRSKIMGFCDSDMFASMPSFVNTFKIISRGPIT